MVFGGDGMVVGRLLDGLMKCVSMSMAYCNFYVEFMILYLSSLYVPFMPNVRVHEEIHYDSVLYQDRQKTDFLTSDLERGPAPPH